MWRKIISGISKFAFEASLMLVCLHMVLIVMFCPPRPGSAVKALVGAETAHRAAQWEGESIGLLWSAAVVMLPVWLAVWFFMFGSQCATERALRPLARAWLWTALIVMTLGGFLFFLAAQQENPQEVWGLSPIRFVPLVLSGFPAGMLANVPRRKTRWAAILPSALSFFLVFVYIAISTPSQV